ncbi:MAG: aldo/keto reductase [Burkholderiaceae bacterium]|nr:aldo/keto reductase [Burkholderiaceae bacterium]
MKPEKRSLPIRRVILGCGTFGGVGSSRHLIGKGMDRAAAFETLNEAAVLGIEMWDTAEGYAGGESESAIGAWLASRPQHITQRIRIATKVAPASLGGDESALFDEAYVASKLAISLERLGRERVALYMAHAPCRITPVGKTVEAFAAVKESGRAEVLGCCNVSSDQLLAFLDEAERRGMPGFTWVQNGFSLLSPDDDKEVRAICRERKLVYSAFSPLAGGVLAGKYRRGEPFPPGSRLDLRPDGRTLSEKTHDALDRLHAMADARGTSCAALALAWIFDHPDCFAPVAGPSRSAPHLMHIAKALMIELSEKDRKELTQAFLAASA